MTQEPIIAINISRSQTLLFYEHYLVYKGERINYTDIEGISYLLTRTTTTVYFVPAGSTSKYNIKIQANGKTHKIEFSAGTFFIGKGKSEKEKDELFARFYAVIENLIKPHVVINLLLKFAQDKELKINSLTITPQGLLRKRFWRDPELLPWDQYYNSVLQQGALHVFRDDAKKKYKEFSACSMDIMNVVVLPDFLNFLFQVKGQIDEKTRRELITKKKELSEATGGITDVSDNDAKGNFCWSCSSPVEEGQKFCTHCGSKLK